MAVVVSHITLALKNFGLNPYIFGTYSDGKPMGLSMAGYGISIFFVLSGFLITYLLLVEKEAQPINVKKFYVRRILRIWPLYYLYLALCVTTIAGCGLGLNWHSALFYVFYAANVPFILDTTLPFLAHYWSLGVEEQFYLFWPWVSKYSERLLQVAIGLIVILIACKVALHFLLPGSILETVIHVTRFHCMMIGAIGAMLYKRQHLLFLKITNNKITQTICWLIMLLIILNKYHVSSVIDNELVSVVALCLIIGQISTRNRIINLDVPVLNFLGKISYGIYVIHPLLIYFFSKLLGHIAIYTPAKYALVYISILAATIILAYVSFTYFEQYFLRLKKRFEVVKSTAYR